MLLFRSLGKTVEDLSDDAVNTATIDRAGALPAALAGRRSGRFAAMREALPGRVHPNKAIRNFYSL